MRRLCRGLETAGGPEEVLKFIELRSLDCRKEARTKMGLFGGSSAIS